MQKLKSMEDEALELELELELLEKLELGSDSDGKEFDDEDEDTHGDVEGSRGSHVAVAFPAKDPAEGESVRKQKPNKSLRDIVRKVSDAATGADPSQAISPRRRSRTKEKSERTTAGRKTSAGDTDTPEDEGGREYGRFLALLSPRLKQQVSGGSSASASADAPATAPAPAPATATAPSTAPSTAPAAAPASGSDSGSGPGGPTSAPVQLQKSHQEKLKLTSSAAAATTPPSAIEKVERTRLTNSDLSSTLKSDLDTKSLPAFRLLFWNPLPSTAQELNLSRSSVNTLQER